MAASLLLAAAIGIVPPQPAPFAGGAPAPSGTRWWLENDGQPVGVPDADVDAARAWSITTGDADVIVAIVDTGVYVAHPQLAAVIAVNGDETPGNGLDDDGNGYADDVTGWDFADDDPDVYDGNAFGLAHGTMVAGLVAGETMGLAPGVRLLPVKVFSDTLSDPDFEAVAAEGILYALARGARVIQIAWDLSGAPGTALSDAFAAAEAGGVVVVVAAGNAGQDADDPLDPAWPAAHPTVLAVAGTDRYDRFVDLPGLFVSGSGPGHVEVAAPTEKLVSTFPFAAQEAFFSGTSAAAPLVSATVALMLSVEPSLTPAQVRAIVTASADPLPTLAGRVEGGRLNAGNAVRMAQQSGISPPRTSLAPVERAVPHEAALFDARDTTGAYSIDWTFLDREHEPAWLVAEHRFRRGGLWPVTLEVFDANGLSHTAHTETLVPFRGVPYAPEDVVTEDVPGLLRITVPGANALRLRFAELDLAGSLILYDAEGDGVRALTGFSTGREEAIRGEQAYLFRIGAGSFTLERVEAAFDGDVNRPPVLDVPGASGATVGTDAFFEAGASDPDGDPVTLAWRLLLRPEGSAAALSATSGTTTSLTPDRDGEYAIAVTASDGVSETSALTWVVTRDGDAGGGLSCSTTARGGGPAAFLVLALAVLLRWRSRR